MLDHANAEVSRLRRVQIRFALRPEYSYIGKAEILNGPFWGAESPKTIKVGKRPTQLVEVSSAIQQRNDVNYISQNHTTFINVLVIMDNQINIRFRRRIFREAKIIPPNERNPTMGNERRSNVWEPYGEM